jgi:hypothetical protein
LPKSGGVVDSFRATLLGNNRRSSVATQKQNFRTARPTMRLPGDAVGIQVPVGRIGAGRNRWQTIFETRDKPSLYRLYNGFPADAEDPGNAMIVEVDGAKRTIEVSAGTSVDVSGKKIRVKAGTGGDGPFVEGWYVLVS